MYCKQLRENVSIVMCVYDFFPLRGAHQLPNIIYIYTEGAKKSGLQIRAEGAKFFGSFRPVLGKISRGRAPPAKQV